MTMLNSKTEPRVGRTSGTPRGANVGGLWQEQPCGLNQQPEIIVARWTDTRTEDRREAVVAPDGQFVLGVALRPVSYTHLRAHETRHDLVCRLLLEKKKN